MNKNKFSNRQFNNLKNANKDLINNLICEEFCYSSELKPIEIIDLSPELLQLRKLDYIISKAKQA